MKGNEFALGTGEMRTYRDRPGGDCASDCGDIGQSGIISGNLATKVLTKFAQLRFPTVEPGRYPLPQHCPYPDCHGSRLKLYQRGCVKPLLDPKLDRVEVQRFRCQECGRTFRIYPRGVGRDQQSDALKKLSVLLYILGLSYQTVSNTLGAMGWFQGKTTVYRHVQEVGRAICDARRDWTASGCGISRVSRADSAVVVCVGQRTIVTVAVSDLLGADVSIEVSNGLDTANIDALMHRLAQTVGADLSIVEDPRAFSDPPEGTQVGQEDGRLHVLCGASYRDQTACASP